MASLTESATMALSPISQSSCQDPLNIDRYLDFDQNFFPSPSHSPELTRSKSIATPASSVGSTSNAFLQNPSSSQQTFNGPSHQYDNYKQQTGLPVGALANTFAVNQADSLSFARNQQFLGIPPSDTFFGLNTTDDFFGFNAPPSLDSAISMTSDMDMDFGSPARDLFLNSVDSSTADFIDPLAIGGQESSSSSQSLPGNTIRAWPGMHQQQAALAKAQAEAQQQKQQAAQLAQKSTASSARRSNATTVRPPTDPIVEERISRLLNQMRHSSVTSSNDDDAGTPNASGNSSHGTRAKKDEEDMDEDERLLASEEGKKLSSKERRQLRNKVSARAFRSRRKEYIGQLEGEIAAKAAEADELKVKNEELMAENTRLTELTRMLLSSPAFSTFLSDLSGNGVALPPTVQKPTSSTVKAGQSSVTRKDVNPHHIAKQKIESRQDVAQIGMALIPETTLDYGTLESASNSWAEGNMDFSLYEAQVFTVMELPQGPAVDQIDSGILSGKSSYSASSYMTDDEPKHELPIVECMPVLEKDECDTEPEICRDDVEIDESDPAFALFADCPSGVTSLAPAADITLFGSIEPEKAFGRVELVLEEQVNGDGEISAGTMEKFERICSSLEAASRRIAALIPHS